MSRSKIFRRKNDQKIMNAWGEILTGEKYQVDPKSDRLGWIAEMSHYHALFDNVGTEAALFEQAAPGLFFQQPGSVSTMGNPVAPTPSQTPFAGGVKNAYSDSGSGDKFPSLLPVAIQVAAKTVGFDLVSVVPMDAPVGFLPYLDYVYAGGLEDSEFNPYLVKVEGIDADTVIGAGTFGDLANNTTATIADGGETLTLATVGFSRVDGHIVFKVISESDGTKPLTDYVAAGNDIDVGGDTYTLTAANVPQLASALENHFSGFTSTSDADYATDAWNGPYLPGTGEVPGSMTRNEGELSKFRQMGLRMFTKFVEAETDQVSIGASVEQIQDLNRVWNFDVINMLENVGVNDLAQAINKRLVDRILTLADVHSAKVEQVEGAGITTLDLNAGVGGFENITTLQRRVQTKILELANLIYHRSRFGAGTFVLTNGRVASALADVTGYSIAQAPSNMSGVGALYPAGTVYGLQVVVDPNMAWGDNRIIIGRKGGDEEPGVKFLPYIMAESLQTISEGTFSPKLGIKSRYAITEAGWHPETQYISMEVEGDLGVLTGSVAPANFS